MELSKLISSGFPSTKKGLPEHLRVFWAMREALYTLQGVPIKGNRIFIPQSLRKEVLECLHAAHQGVNGMMANANQRLFWPGLDANIRLTRAQCHDCNEISPSQPSEPLSPPPSLDFPFQHTVTDFFELSGNKYLLYADRFTGWIEIILATKMDAKDVCDHLRKWFCTFGVPQELCSDALPSTLKNIYSPSRSGGFINVSHLHNTPKVTVELNWQSR